MKIRLLIVHLFFLIIVSPPMLFAAPTVEVRGVRLVGDGVGEDMSMRPFNWSKGTSVSLLLQMPEGGIVSVDRDKSAFTSFADDKGTDLLKKPQGSSGFSFSGFQMSPSISKDGTALMAEFSAPQLPVRGATRIQASGKMIVKVATKKEVHELKNVELKPQVALSAGPLNFTVDKTGKPDWGSDQYPFAVTFKSSGGFDSVISVAFTDSTGASVGSKKGSTMSMTFNQVSTVKQEYQLAREVSKVNISIVRWTDLHPVEIPLKLDFGVGF